MSFLSVFHLHVLLRTAWESWKLSSESTVHKLRIKFYIYHQHLLLIYLPISTTNSAPDNKLRMTSNDFHWWKINASRLWYYSTSLPHVLGLTSEAMCCPWLSHASSFLNNNSEYYLDTFTELTGRHTKLQKITSQIKLNDTQYLVMGRINPVVK